MSSGVQYHPDQHGKTPSLLKMYKLAGCSDAHQYFQLLRRLRQENCLNPGCGGCSEPRSCHCTPAWATERNSVLNKTITKTMEVKFSIILKYVYTTLLKEIRQNIHSS